MLNKNKLNTITVVDATDMPEEVEDWCIENEYSTHCTNSVAKVPNDDNPFANWLRDNGYVFSDTDEGGFDHVAIIAT